MVLNNYYAYNYYREKQQGYLYSGAVLGYDTGIKAIDGTNVKIGGNVSGGESSHAQCREIVGRSMRMYADNSFILSDSEDPVESTIYNLSSASGISVGSTSTNFGGGSGKQTYTATITGTNTGSSAVSIRKIGICKTPYYYSYGTSTGPKFIMAVCEFDTPYVIEPGSFNITVEWIME